MKTVLAAAICTVASLAFVGCASSHEEGVKSNLRTQWTPVAANTMATTDAAKEVFESRGYKEVYANATKDDGKASAKLADGTKVNVAIEKEGTAGSQVSVTVGALGSPTLGAELAKEIKMRAEGTSTTRSSM